MCVSSIPPYACVHVSLTCYCKCEEGSGETRCEKKRKKGFTLVFVSSVAGHVRKCFIRACVCVCACFSVHVFHLVLHYRQYLSVHILTLNMHQWIHICCHAFVLTWPQTLQECGPCLSLEVFQKRLVGDWYGLFFFFLTLDISIKK